MSAVPYAPIVPDLDPRVIDALDNGKFADAAELLEDFAVIYPPAAAWIAELVPVLRLAAAGSVEAAYAWAHWSEARPPTPVAIRVTSALARAAEEKDPWTAAHLFASVKDDPKMLERASVIARRAGGKPEEVAAKFAESFATFYRTRAEQVPDDYVAHERLATALIATPDAARAAAERSVALAPTVARGWKTLAAIERTAAGAPAAEIVLRAAADRNPAAAWPWVAMGRDVADTEFDKACRFADRALAADPNDWDALELRRRMLRKLERWQELADLIEYMIGATPDRLKLEELYDEWARTTSGPLRDAIGAVELQKQADFFKNEAAISEFYWKNLAENDRDKSVWSEVDGFFRANRMWTDLGRLLLMKIERSFGDERLGLLDELRVVWLMVPGRGDAAWADVVQAEIERAEKDEDLRKALEGRLVGIEFAPEDKPAADVSGYVLIAAGVLAVVVVVLVAVAVLPFFLH